MPRFPWLTLMLAGLTIYALWGRTLLVVLGAGLAVVFAYHVGRAEERRDRDEAWEADLRSMLEEDKVER
jgi:uncharacterized membrane protein YdjX (TVP38/TMEM64 family)